MSGPGVQAEQPEQPGRRRREGVVRPGEDRSHLARRVAGVQHVEPVSRLAELLGQGGEREVGLPCPGGGDAERERQPGTGGDDGVDRLGFRGDPPRTEPPAEQLTSLHSRQHVEGQRSSFYVSYGNSVVKGTITWYNLSAGVDGIIKSGGDCRSAWVTVENATDSDSWFSPKACNGGSISISHTFKQTGAGGWTAGNVFLLDENGRLTGSSDRCYRGEAYCQTV